MKKLLKDEVNFCIGCIHNINDGCEHPDRSNTWYYPLYIPDYDIELYCREEKHCTEGAKPYSNGPVIKNKGTLSKADQKHKFDKDKIRYSLYPLEVLKEVVEVLEFGANKYEEESWKNVEGKRYYDAALRHIFAWKNGDKVDDETKKNHLAHAICCLTFLLSFDLKEEK